MNDERAHHRYALLFIAACAAVLLPVVVLNYLLGLRSFGGNDVVREASRWQQATRGITYAPPLSANPSELWPVRRQFRGLPCRHRANSY